MLAAAIRKACWPSGGTGDSTTRFVMPGDPARCWLASAQELSAGLRLGSRIRGPAGSPLRGLGWIPNTCCPHYNGEKERRPAVQKFVASGNVSSTLALDDGAAAHSVGRKLLRIVTSRPNAGAYRVQ